MSTISRSSSWEKILQDYDDAIRLSANDASWPDPPQDHNVPIVLSKAASRTRDAFLFLLTHAPAQPMIEAWGDHPFWTRWVAKGKKNKALHLALSSSKDPAWASWLLTKRPPTMEEAASLLEACVIRYNAVPMLEALEQSLPARFTVTGAMLLQAARHTSLETFEWLWNHPSREALQKTEGLEMGLLKRGRAQQRLDRIHQCIVKIWEAWGEPSADTLHALFKISLSNHVGGPSPSLMPALAARHYPGSPSWSDRDFQAIFSPFLARGGHGLLEWLDKQQWTIPSQYWDEALAHCPPRVRASLEKMYMERHVHTSETPARLVPKRM